jgi:hypothetical protein
MLTYSNLPAEVADVCAIAELHTQHSSALQDVNDIEWLVAVETLEAVKIDTLNLFKDVYDICQTLHFTPAA